MPASERVVWRQFFWLRDFGNFDPHSAERYCSSRDFGMTDDDWTARGEDSWIGTRSHDDFGADAGDIA
jgi:hypothetical protein